MLDDHAIRGLLLRAAARDEGSADAFRRLYEASAPTLLGVALRIVGRRELAEEVLHDAFTRIWRAAQGFDPLATQPVAWMAAIVRNRAIDVRASHDVSRVDSYHAAPLDADPDGSLERLVDWGPGADETLDRQRSARWLRECLGRLAAFERQALALALAVAIGLRVIDPGGGIAPAAQAIARLSGQGAAPRVTAFLSADRRALELRAARPVIAGPAQSYELWLLPAEGGAPVSLAVLGALDARFVLPPERLERLRAGARLAISVEPAGGSPSGAPTGPVILIGRVSTIS